MKIDLEDFFMDFIEAAKPFVPESDHVEMYVEILRSLHDSGYHIQMLHGHDDELDEAIEEIVDNIDEFNEEDY